MTHDENNSPSILIKPIGYIKNDLEKIGFHPKSGSDSEEKKQQNRTYYQALKKTISELIIHTDYAALLDGVADFSHIVVIYWPHLLPEDERKIKKVHPMGRKDIPLQGVFATRSPARPNPVLISTVKLIERKETILKVMGLEALNGSPLIDIKPYTLNDQVDQPVFPDWIVKLNNDLEED